MNNVFVYIEIEEQEIADVSLELLTKGRELANTLGVKLEAVVIGKDVKSLAPELAKYGADTVWFADDEIFAPFRTLPHTAVMVGLIQQEKPQIALFGATPVGRDFAPRVSSALHSGLTADCTELVIGEHKDAKSGKEYDSLLYQIRPAFGGNIIATIVNPECRPQMATVREGVMRKEELPVVAADCSATEMIHRISKGGLGLIVIVENGLIEGIVTDGDVRRAMEKYRAEFFNIHAIDIATRNPKSIRATQKLIEAEKCMTENKINSLLVTSDKGALEGVIQLYDIKL